MDAIARAGPRRPIRAAGGLVVRPDPGGEHVLLVHRPRFDDWSLPKGKLKRGEHPLAAAVREVREETAVWGVPGVRLPTVTYQARSGPSLVDKTVDWWAMAVADDGPVTLDGAHPADGAASDEVDEVAWLPISRALEALTYERDRLVVSAYADLPPLSRPVVLLHHASVEENQPWSGPDVDRPLGPPGAAQARALADLLGLLRPARLVSAQPLRCRQTLAGLSQALAVGLDVDARFDDRADPAAAAGALRSLAGDTAVVVCSQGWLIPAAVSRLSGRPEPRHAVPMGGALVLSFSGDRLVAADALSLDPS